MISTYGFLFSGRRYAVAKGWVCGRESTMMVHWSNQAIASAASSDIESVQTLCHTLSVGREEEPV